MDVTTYRGLSSGGAPAAVMRKYQEAQSDTQREKLQSYFAVVPCPTCGGKRLKPEILAVTGGESIHEVCEMSVFDCHQLLLGDLRSEGQQVRLRNSYRRKSSRV